MDGNEACASVDDGLTSPTSIQTTPLPPITLSKMKQEILENFGVNLRYGELRIDRATGQALIEVPMLPSEEEWRKYPAPLTPQQRQVLARHGVRVRAQPGASPHSPELDSAEEQAFKRRILETTGVDLRLFRRSLPRQRHGGTVKEKEGVSPGVEALPPLETPAADDAGSQNVLYVMPAHRRAEMMRQHCARQEQQMLPQAQAGTEENMDEFDALLLAHFGNDDSDKYIACPSDAVLQAIESMYGVRIVPSRDDDNDDDDDDDDEEDLDDEEMDDELREFIVPDDELEEEDGDYDVRRDLKSQDVDEDEMDDDVEEDNNDDDDDDDDDLESSESDGDEDGDVNEETEAPGIVLSEEDLAKEARRKARVLRELEELMGDGLEMASGPRASRRATVERLKQFVQRETMMDEIEQREQWGGDDDDEDADDDDNDDDENEEAGEGEFEDELEAEDEVKVLEDEVIREAIVIFGAEKSTKETRADDGSNGFNLAEEGAKGENAPADQKTRTHASLSNKRDGDDDDVLPTKRACMLSFFSDDD